MSGSDHVASTPVAVTMDAVQERKAQTHAQQRKEAVAVASAAAEMLCDRDRRRILEHSEKGASSWLAVLPIRRHGFSLSRRLGRRYFQDAVASRYGWPLQCTPESCICGHEFSVEHQLCCSRGGGGGSTLRHNEVRDLLAEELTMVCSAVGTEPTLAPLVGVRFRFQTGNVSEEARLDVSARGFWNRGEEAF